MDLSLLDSTEKFLEKLERDANDLYNRFDLGSVEELGVTDNIQIFESIGVAEKQQNGVTKDNARNETHLMEVYRKALMEIYSNVQSSPPINPQKHQQTPHEETQPPPQSAHVSPRSTRTSPRNTENGGSKKGYRFIYNTQKQKQQPANRPTTATNAFQRAIPGADAVSTTSNITEEQSMLLRLKRQQEEEDLHRQLDLELERQQLLLRQYQEQREGEKQQQATESSSARDVQIKSPTKQPKVEKKSAVTEKLLTASANVKRRPPPSPPKNRHQEPSITVSNGHSANPVLPPLSPNSSAHRSAAVAAITAPRKPSPTRATAAAQDAAIAAAIETATEDKFIETILQQQQKRQHLSSVHRINPASIAVSSPEYSAPVEYNHNDFEDASFSTTATADKKPTSGRHDHDHNTDHENNNNDNGTSNNNNNASFTSLTSSSLDFSAMSWYPSTKMPYIEDLQEHQVFGSKPNTNPNNTAQQQQQLHHQQQQLQESSRFVSAPSSKHPSPSKLRTPQNHRQQQQQQQQQSVHHPPAPHESPTSSGISQPSSLILRQVLSSRIPFENIHIPGQNLSFNTSPPHRGQTAEIVNQQQNPPVYLPSPTTHVPEERALYYADYLIHRRNEVRLSALQALHKLVKQEYFGGEEGRGIEGVLPTIADSLVSTLEAYETQEEKFNHLAVETLAMIGYVSTESVKILIKMLKDPTQFELYESIIWCLFRTGAIGIEAMLEEASDANTEWDSFILTHLANHPQVQASVIVPSLIRECNSADLNRRTSAVRALSKLKTRAVNALPVLFELLVAGALDRKLIVKAIRGCGKEGEKLLIHLLAQNASARVRACAAYALGLPPPNAEVLTTGGDYEAAVTELKVIVNADFAITFTSPPQVIYLSSSSEISDDEHEHEEHLLFDARELVACIRRGLPEGLYDEPVPVNFAIIPGLTELLIRVLDNYNKKSNRQLTRYNTFNTSLNLSGGFLLGNTTPQQRQLNQPSLDMLRSSMLIKSKLSNGTKSAQQQQQQQQPSSSNKNNNNDQRERSPSPDNSNETDNHQNNNNNYNNNNTTTIANSANPDNEDMETSAPPPPNNATIFVATNAAVKALVQALGDIDPTVRLTAASSIGNLTGHTASIVIEPLCNALRDPCHKVRAEAASSIGRLAMDNFPTNTVHQLIGLLKDGYWKVRFSACRSLARFAERAEPAIPHLLRLLKDGSVNRTQVAETLVAIGERGELALMDVVQESQARAQARISACHGLAYANIHSFNIDRVVECLFATSKDRIPSVRRAVLEALGCLGRRAKETLTYLRARSLLPFLYSFLKDKERSVRETAAEVLAAAGPHGELLLIEGLLKDSNSIIRASAGYGLMHVGPRAIRTLLLALNDKDPLVRQSVGNAIDSIGIPAIVSTLRQRPKSQRDSVIHSAREILTSPFPNSEQLQSNLNLLITKLENLSID